MSGSLLDTAVYLSVVGGHASFGCRVRSRGEQAPGWANTPGVEFSLPRFHRTTRP